MQTLLTKEIRKRLPKLYATQHEKDPVVQVKFFSLVSNCRWYATEFDGEDTFFGLVDGFEQELGYFLLSELRSLRGPCNVPLMERDLYFKPTRISELGLDKSRCLS